MDDLISRQAAYEALTAYYHHTTITLRTCNTRHCMTH